MQAATLLFQLVVAYVASTLTWISFVIVFNETFELPSSQQWWSLFMTLAVTSLWEVSNRMVSHMTVAC